MFPCLFDLWPSLTPPVYSRTPIRPPPLSRLAQEPASCLCPPPDWKLPQTRALQGSPHAQKRRLHALQSGCTCCASLRSPSPSQPAYLTWQTPLQLYVVPGPLLPRTLTKELGFVFRPCKPPRECVHRLLSLPLSAPTIEPATQAAARTSPPTRARRPHARRLPFVLVEFLFF